MSPLSKLFDVKGDERARLKLLWLQSLFIGFAIVSYESAATSLFLSAFEVSSLPLVYIGVSIVSVVFGLLYLRLESTVAPSRLFSIAVAVIIAGMLGARGLIAITDSKWAFLATMIWLDVSIVFLGLQFWSLAGLLFNVRQSKRLFGIVGSGEVVGVVLGGLLMPLLVRLIGTANILLWAAVCLSAAFATLLLTVALNRSRLKDAEEDEDEEEDLSIGAMLRIPYLLLLFTFALFVVLSDYFVDFFFFAEIDAQFPDEEKMAAFLGPFFAAVGAFSFFAKVFLFNRIMKRFGVIGGLLTLPVAVLISIGLSLGASYFFPDASVFGFTWLFLFILLTKLFDLGLRPSVSEPTALVLFQPFPPARRVRVQSFNDSVIEPISSGLTGLLLLGLSMGLGWGIVEIAWATGGILVIWIGLCFAVRAGYAGQLTQTFEKRRLVQPGATGQIDQHELRPHLTSDEPGEVIYVLRLLAGDGDVENVEADLVNALEHPSPEVRREAIELLRQHGGSESESRIESLLSDKETDLHILSEAVLTHCALREDDAVDAVTPYLNHPDPMVSRAALVGLVKHGGITGVLAAGQKLQQILQSESPLQRRHASQILSEIGIASFYRPLGVLLNDPDPTVRRSATQAAGQLKSVKLTEKLVALLADPLIEADAVSALSRLGEGAVPELLRQFEAAAEHSPQRIGIAVALRDVGGAETAGFLFSHLENADADLRGALSESLARMKFHVEDGDRSSVEALVGRELTLIAQSQVDPKWAERQPFLGRVMAAESKTAIRRAFNLLALFCQSEAILLARTRFFLDTETQRALAMEILDNILGGELRLKVLKALDEAESGDGGLSLDTPDIQQLLARPQSDLSAFARASAIWAVHSAGIRDRASTLAPLQNHPSALLRETVEFHLNPNAGNSELDLAIAKVELLSTASIFQASPPLELAALALSLTPRRIPPEETFIHQGQTATSLFVLASGNVRVHVGGKDVAELEAGAVIGEFAALDPEPRSASVSALNDCVVLELEGADLREMMSRRPAVCRGVFRVLCSRLRDAAELEKAPPLNKTIESFENREAPKQDGFPLLEKNRALAGVSLFRGVPDLVLNAISQRLIVKFAKPGAILIRHGEIGESMFILVDGRVRVHRGAQTLAKLSSGSVFGELSALDPEPRSATVTALGEVTVFQISGSLIYKLTTESPELIDGISRELCRRSREALSAGRLLEAPRAHAPRPDSDRTHPSPS